MYQLAASFKAHEADVKDIVAIDDETFASCSRDSSVKTWFRDEPTATWDHFVLHHAADKSYINSLCFSEGIVYEGGSNKSISGFPYLSNIQENENEPVFQLLQHRSNVCALSSYHDQTNADNYIISSSWDTTAAVWKNNELLHQLSGHTASVWDSKVISPGTFITCSADKTVKIWSGNKCVKTVSNLHTDVIRSVDVDVSKGLFATASNDGLIQICDLETGTIKNTLYGHTNFIYKVKFAANNKLLSCGEDRTMRVWNLETMSEEQCIILPTISVWCFDQLVNGDVVVGSSDSMIRVFTQSEKRVASKEEISKFAEEVSNSSINSKTVDEKNISPYETILAPGKKEGQVVVIKTANGNLEAHQYSNNAWAKVGDVVGGTGSDNKVEYEGKKYDFVFDVDIEDGKPPLKLPYNANDNLYTVAENFLSKYELPASYREEIVRFIISNTGGVAMDNGPPPTTQAQPPAPATNTKVLPSIDQYLCLNHFKKEVLLNGLNKINMNEETQIDEKDMSEFSNALDDPASNVDFLYTQAEFIKDHWKLKTPAFDLIRIIAQYLPSSNEVIFYIQEGLSSSDWAVQLLAVRCLVNCFSNSEWGLSFVGQADVYKSCLEKIRDEIPANFKQSSHYTVAVASLMFNYSVLILKQKLPDLVPSIADPLNNKFGKSLQFVDNEESAYRMLLAYGNLSVIEPTLKQFAKSIKWLKDLNGKYDYSTRFLDVFNDLGM